MGKGRGRLGACMLGDMFVRAGVLARRQKNNILTNDIPIENQVSEHNPLQGVLKSSLRW